MTQSKTGIIPLWRKLAYGTGEAGGNFTFSIISSYLTVFYTDIVGLTPLVISTIMLIARIWDAVNDPMMGIVAEKTQTRWGKYRPYLLFAAPILAIFTALAFYNPGWVGMKSAIYCGLTYILSGMAYTATQVAFQSLVNVMTEDNQERIVLISFRGFIGNIASLIVNATMMPAILYFGNGDTSNGDGYFYAAIIFSILGTICYWAGFFGSKEVVTSTQMQGEKPNVWKSLKEAFKDGNIRKLLIGYLIYMCGVFGRVGIMVYLFIYVLGRPEWMAVSGSVMTISMMIPNLIQPFFTKRFDKKVIMCACLALGFAGSIIMFAGANAGNIIIVCIGTAMFHGCGAMVGGIAFGLIAEIIDDLEVRTGRRADAIVISVTSFAVKLGNALAGSLGIAALAAVGYIANAEQSETTKMAMNGVINIAPGILFLLAIIPFILIGMNNKKAAENSKVLSERRVQKEA